MIYIDTEKDCCGCMACFSVCPQSCIEIKEKTLGAVFPEADTQKCISCGLCDTVCTMKNKPVCDEFSQKSYAAFSQDVGVRFRGSSGGMFETFAKALLKQGYVIYASAFDDNLKLKCTKATNEHELKPLTKSKYLQSDMSEKFNEIKNSLDSGKKILFVSTPCQVSALKLFLKQPYENLITVDFICHGVPSQNFFDECIAYDEQRDKVAIKKFIFREKIANGSTPHYYSINNKKPQLYFKSTYYMAFQKYISLRESCYDCNFAGQKRYSDITIGDFHDIDKYIQGINRFDGVSTVIINTHRGSELFDKVSDTLEVFPLELSRLVKDRVLFSGGTKRPAGRDAFIKSYNTNSFEKFVKENLNPKEYFTRNVYYHLPLWIRKMTKKIFGV